LVLAALRGRQPVLGPIILNTSRYGSVGRVGGLILGTAIWLLVWSGLAWIMLNSFLPSSTIANTLSAKNTTVAAVDTATPTSFPPTFTATAKVMVTSTATPTELPVTPTPIITLTITAIFEASPTPLPTPRATPSLTPTIIITATATSTSTVEIVDPSDEPSLSEIDIIETVRPTPLPPLTVEERSDVIGTMKEGNGLLREAILLANEENIEKLKRLWRGRAFDKAEEFATEHYNNFAQPLEVQFEYITTPKISDQSTANQVLVISQETWFYTGPTTTQKESLEFIYTLSREDDNWVITSYTYRNLPDKPS
jgi:hypothetical protein